MMRREIESCVRSQFQKSFTRRRGGAEQRLVLATKARRTLKNDTRRANAQGTRNSLHPCAMSFFFSCGSRNISPPRLRVSARKISVPQREYWMIHQSITRKKAMAGVMTDGFDMAWEDLPEYLGPHVLLSLSAILLGVAIKPPLVIFSVALPPAAGPRRSRQHRNRPFRASHCSRFLTRSSWGFRPSRSDIRLRLPARLGFCPCWRRSRFIRCCRCSGTRSRASSILIPP